MVLSISVAHADRPCTLGVAPTHLEQGKALRLWLGEGEPLPCALVGMTDNGLIVAQRGETTTVACESIRRLDTRGRGTLAGAGIAGLAGGAVGAVLFAILSKTSEAEDPPSAGSAAVVGALAFGVPSAAFGALVGAAVPTWKTRYIASSEGTGGKPPALPAAAPSRRPDTTPGMSELWCSLGCATHARGKDRHLGAAGRIGVCSPLWRSIRVGAELGFMKAGPDAYAGDGSALSEPRMLRHAGAIVLVPLPPPRQSLFFTFGLGGYTADEISDAYLGFSAGCGVRSGGRPRVGLEARIHDNLLSVQEPLPAVCSLATSLILSW
jgi:hypothetical protein